MEIGFSFFIIVFLSFLFHIVTFNLIFQTEFLNEIPAENHYNFISLLIDDCSALFNNVVFLFILDNFIIFLIVLYIKKRFFNYREYHFSNSEFAKQLLNLKIYDTIELNDESKKFFKQNFFVVKNVVVNKIEENGDLSISIYCMRNDFTEDSFLIDPSIVEYIKIYD